MAILFGYELNRLTADLANGGYDVLRVYRFPKVPARIVQLLLINGVLVRWDRQIGRLYVDGAFAQRTRVEDFLHLTYEASWLARMWAFHRRAASLATAALILLASGIIFTAAVHSRRASAAIRADSRLTAAE